MQQRRFAAIARCEHDRRDHIAVTIAVGHHLAALHPLVTAEAQVVAALLGRARGSGLRLSVGWNIGRAHVSDEGPSLTDPEETVDFLNSGRSRTTARIVDPAPEHTLWDRWVVQP